MAHKVLIPLDGSDLSERIVDPILEHFAPQTHQIALLRVCLPSDIELAANPDVRPTDPPAPRFPTAAESIRALSVTPPPLDLESAIARMQQELAPVRRRLEAAGFRVESLALVGDPATEIANAVSTHSISLVAMTTHGRTGLRRLVMGSVAEHVVRNAPVPVLLLRAV